MKSIEGGDYNTHTLNASTLFDFELSMSQMTSYKTTSSKSDWVLKSLAINATYEKIIQKIPFLI